MATNVGQRSAHDNLVVSFEMIYAVSPWPMLMLDRDGQLIGSSDDRCHASSPGAPTPLRQRAVLYVEALGKLTQQPVACDMPLQRRGANGETVYERLYLRPTAWGSSVTIVDESPAHRPQAADLQTARLAALGFMVAGVCHELTNPLTSLRSIVQLLRHEDSLDVALLHRGMDTISRNVQRILDISRRLVQFSRVGDEPRRRFSIDDAVEEAIVVLREDGQLREMMVEHVEDRSCVVTGSIGEMREVFLNLLVNAVHATAGRGLVRIATSREDGCIVVRVSDNGPGIPKTDRQRLFEPFFSTKAPGQGTGLGLAISREIALEHGGTLALDRADRGLTIFCLSLPEPDA